MSVIVLNPQPVERCKAGLHDLTPENRYMNAGNSGTWRCRECARAIAKITNKTPLSRRSPTFEEWAAGKKRECSKGHAFACEADFRRPTARDVARNRLTLQCRTCLAAISKRCKVNANFNEQTIRRIVSLIVDFGFTKHNLTGRRGRDKTGKHLARSVKGVTDITRFNNWLRKNPKMAAKLEPHLERNRAVNKADGMAKRRKDKLRISPNSDVPSRIDAALPKWLTGDDRLDVSSAIYLALADGKLRVKDIEAKARSFITAHHKQSDNIGRYGFYSLDAPIGDDNPAARIERLTDSDRMWA